MGRTDEITLKEALRLFLERYRLSGRLNELRLIGSWEKVVGPLIARHTRQLKIKNKVLYVEVDSAALRNELGYAKSKLLNQLNQLAGETVIRDIVFR